MFVPFPFGAQLSGGFLVRSSHSRPQQHSPRSPRFWMCCPHTRFEKPFLDPVITGFPPITPYLPVCVFCGGVMLWEGVSHLSCRACPEHLPLMAGRSSKSQF